MCPLTKINCFVTGAVAVVRLIREIVIRIITIRRGVEGGIGAGVAGAAAVVGAKETAIVALQVVEVIDTPTTCDL